MKLVRLYCNKDSFHNIQFNDGMNIILGKVKCPEDKNRDSHNLGKSTLVEILDFMLLKEINNDHIFKRHGDIFTGYVFYLEILLNSGEYITIKRDVNNHTKVCFLESATDTICNETTTWNFADLLIKNAVPYLNTKLAFDILSDCSFRKTVSFFLRTQNDYGDLFQLSKYQKGKQKEWKPVVFEMLGFKKELLQDRYDIEQSLDNLNKSEKSPSPFPNLKPDDYDKINGRLDVIKRLRDETQEEIDRFDFYAKERELDQDLVENIEKEIAELNNEEYRLKYDLDKTKSGIKEKISYNIQQLKELYAEVKVYFPDALAHSYEELIDFNNKVTEERNKYLKEQVKKISGQLREVNTKLSKLNEERGKMLSFLTDKDTFKKFKGYQVQLAKAEGEIVKLENQLEILSKAEEIEGNRRELKDRLEEVNKKISFCIREGSETYRSLRTTFFDIFKSVFEVAAYPYVRILKNGNVEFDVETQNLNDGNVTAEDKGNTYMKMLCATFDLSVLITYSSHSFFRFVYHDGVMEGLDNRKKELFINKVRDICNRYGIQYIFSSIEDDMPENILAEFTDEEKCLILSDEDEKGKLFGFSF